MSASEDKARNAIAEQAAEWFVRNEEGALDDRQAAQLAAWLAASPVHVREFLGTSVLARDLRELKSDPEFSIVAVVLNQAGAEEAAAPRWSWGRLVEDIAGNAPRWRSAAYAAAAFGALSLLLLALWSFRPGTHAPAAAETLVLHFETHHGEQESRRLPDNSVLHLNTDSAVTIRFGAKERLVELTAGEADFQVAHEAGRAFRVLTGGAQVIAVGTNFDVRLQQAATVVTVAEGRVAVGPSVMPDGNATDLSPHGAPRFVQVGVDQQITVVPGEWPATPVTVNAQHVTAWLHREIVFENERLESVALEFNRYAPKPIEIATPALKDLEISGEFSTDDSETFIAFLRSLEGVQVEVTATRIRVSQLKK